ncbi:DUF2798 domain-containing protein [Psychrobacter sp. UBA3962]|uniref:DUF2798 domain-containing protein n=1 Tax=Psychrobacter sp. UBA3962 TaxID=1947352 RepID=UPI0025E17217|nr:DUF2798 domain-containing protein [Psychrobacter sp. UBA3962]
MTKSTKAAQKPAKIRISIKFYRLIFTGLMALLMSLIISAALILVKEGYNDLFFDHLLSSWKLAFVFAWPSAYLCAYLIQTHVLSRIDFY